MTGTTVYGRWPRLVGGLWREFNYTVTQLMHSECGRIFRGPLARGPYKRGTTVLLYCYSKWPMLSRELLVKQ